MAQLKNTIINGDLDVPENNAYIGDTLTTEHLVANTDTTLKGGNFQVQKADGNPLLVLTTDSGLTAYTSAYIQGTLINEKEVTCKDGLKIAGKVGDKQHALSIYAHDTSNEASIRYTTKTTFEDTESQEDSWVVGINTGGKNISENHFGWWYKTNNSEAGALKSYIDINGKYIRNDQTDGNSTDTADHADRADRANDDTDTITNTYFKLARGTDKEGSIAQPKLSKHLQQITGWNNFQMGLYVQEIRACASDETYVDPALDIHAAIKGNSNIILASADEADIISDMAKPSIFAEGYIESMDKLKAPQLIISTPDINTIISATDVLIDCSQNSGNLTLLGNYKAANSQASIFYRSQKENKYWWNAGLGAGQSDNNDFVFCYKGEESSTPNIVAYITTGGNIVSDSGYVQASYFRAMSDKRLKKNIKQFKSKKSILDLPIYTFDFINGRKNNIGCLAQDLKKLYPEMVDKTGKYLGIQESKLVYPLILEVKALKEEVNELKKAIAIKNK